MTKHCISEKDCKKFARKLGFSCNAAYVNCEKCICTVRGKRCLGKVKYLPTKQKINSSLINEISFSTERSHNGCVLNLGRIPVLPSELNDFVKNLVKHDGIHISSINSDWVKVRPNIITVSIYSDSDQPLEFACAVRDAMKQTCSKKLGKNILSTIIKVNKKHKDNCKKKACCSSSSSSSCSSSSSSTCTSSSSTCPSSSSSSSCSSSSSSDCSSSSSSDCSSSSSYNCCTSSSSSCSSSSSSDCSSSSSSDDCSSSTDWYY